MRLVRPAIAAVCGIALCSAPAPASPHQPTAPWHLDYDTAQCVATRQYGTDADPLILGLKPSPSGTVMRVLVIRKGSAEVDQKPATLRFGDTELKTSLLHYSDPKTRLRVAAVNLPMAVFKANAAAPTLSITSGEMEAEFALSALPRLVAEVDKCVLFLQQYWNFGEKNRAAVVTPPRPAVPLKAIFSSSDYPGMALEGNQQGDVTMTFLVDEKGQIADCGIDSTSDIPALDTMSCYVARTRARFRPALSADRRPIRSAYTERVIWRIRD